jgi:hypothetical protein
MSFTSWLRNVRSALAPSRNDRKHRRQRPLRAATHWPQFELLEDRCLLSFSPAVSYPAGLEPQALLTADFNGDGKLDLTVANYYSSTVSVLLGNADGTFQPALTSATGAYPQSVAVGDFNADGKLDLATANTNDGGVSVLRGNGDGTFQAATSLGVAGNPTSVAVGDFNGDGKLDLGVTSSVYSPGYWGWSDGYERYYYHPAHDDSYANVLLGQGDALGKADGTFSAPTPFWLGDSGHLSAVVGDFNGDGNQDLAAAHYWYWTVSVLLGDGLGNLYGLTDFGAGYEPRSVAAGDLNGDSKLDLVTANSDHSVSVLLANGLGSFGAAQNYAVGTYPWSVAVGDFNRDGKADLVTANQTSGTVSVLLGNGDGTFQLARDYDAGGYPVSVAVGDFNGDLFPDVAVANSSYNIVSVLINDQSWPPPTPSLTISDVRVTEGNTGTVNASFTLSLSAAYGQPVTVHYQTANGSATAGSDYTGASGDVTFAVGETSKTIMVAVIGDRSPEATENFVVNLSAPTNATIADGQGVGTIVDDEPRISISDVSKLEGKTAQTTLFVFTVTLSAAYDQAVTMSFHTVDGTATTSDSDYIAKTGTLTFNPGETTKTITIEVKGDSKREAAETFYLDLFGNSSNSLFTKNRGIGTILNDD